MFWPDGQVLSVLVLTELVFTKLPVPSFWLQVSAGGETVQTLACVTIGADVTTVAVGLTAALGSGQL
jgi:hypothetical protein